MRITSIFSRSISVALSLSLAFGSAFSFVGQVYAAEPSSEVGATNVGSASPTVVRELTEKRTETATHYLLSNGDIKAVISQAPVRFKDKSGAWEDLDRTLLPVDDQGTVRSAATPLAATMGRQTSNAFPVKVSGDGYSVQMDYLGAAENAKVVLGDTATYLGVAQDTNLSYEALDDGIKETFVLSSPNAPTMFRMALRLDGLEIEKTPEGTWALVRPGEHEPQMYLGGLCVFDSSENAAGDPAYCNDTSMDVVDAGNGLIYVSYQISKAWLSEPGRVFPVKVDPSVTKSVGLDTFVSSKYPDTSYGSSTELKCGYWDSATGYNRSYVSFDISTIPTTSYVVDTNFKIHQFHASDPSNKRDTYLASLQNTFSDASTWNSQSSKTNDFSSKVFLDSKLTKTVQFDAGDLNWDVDQIVQDWVDGTRTNKGFLLFQVEDSTSSTSLHWRKFDSKESATTSDRPSLTVTYSNPTFTGTSVDKQIYRVGDKVKATVKINTGWPHDINTVHLAVNYLDASGNKATASMRRGFFKWNQTVPDDDIWAYQACPGSEGGYVAYNKTGYNCDKAVLKFDKCYEERVDDGQGSGTNYMKVTFVWEVGKDYGDIQDNDLNVRLYMGHTDSDSTWPADPDKTWQTINTGFDIAIAPTAGIRAETTASADWYTDTPGGKNDSATAGRGSVKLTWDPTPLAAGYQIQLFDGSIYRQVGTTSSGTATTWTTAGKKLFPSDSWIASNTSSLASGSNPFAAGSVDLRDDPRSLYAATPGTSNDDLHGYLFKVIPVPASGVVDTASAEVVAVGLDDRTIGINDDPRHAIIDLENTVGGQASLEGDTGALQLDATDLSIASYGPEASLSRHYDSSCASTSSYAPGWRFSFEENIAVGSTTATYTDTEGDSHRFLKQGTVWNSPAGFTGSLAASGTGWALTYPGPTTTYFDSAGRLTSSHDSNGNKVSYGYTAGDGNDVAITAANGQAILVERDAGGQVTRSSITTAGATREVVYTPAAADGTAAVGYFPNGGTSVRREIAYGYSGGRLTRVATLQDEAAAWDYSYSTDRLVRVSGPEYAPGSRSVTDISTSTMSPWSRVTLARTGLVDDNPATVDEHYDINPTGTLARQFGAHVSGATEPITTKTYSQEGFEQGSCEPLGRETVAVLDSKGNPLFTRDGNGGSTVTTYDVGGRPLQSTDPLGSITYSTYDSRGNLTREEKTLNETERSHLAYTYDGFGRVLSEVTSLTATTASVKANTYAYPFDEPSMIAERATLKMGAVPTTVTTQATFDGFGQRLTGIDASGLVTANVYDSAGRLSTSTVAGVSTNYLYDAFGRQTASWKSAPSTTSVIDYTTTSYDGAGRVLSVSTWDGSLGNHPQKIVSTTVHSYDALGREVTSHNSLVSGLPAKTWFDAAGNQTAVWDDGQPSGAYDPLSSTRTRYDVAGRETSSCVAGASDTSATITDHNPDGTIAHTLDGEGVATDYTYDVAGNETQRVSSAEGTTTTEYDCAGRALTVAESNGTYGVLMTNHQYDLAGREMTADADDSPSETIYNELGWKLQTTDADSIVSSSTFDAAGREIVSSIAGSATLNAYDAAGRLVSTRDADGRLAQTGYDEFGRANEVTETALSGVVKHVVSTYDTLDRLLTANDTISKVKRTYAYPSSDSSLTQVTMTYAGVITTATIDSAGHELARLTNVNGLSSGITWTILDRDDASRVTSVSAKLASGAPLSWHRTYDGVGRLTSVEGSGARNVGYGYDADGKKIREWGTVGTGAMQASMDATYTYAADGSLSRAVIGQSDTAYSFNQLGRLRDIAPSGCASRTLSYDSASRLTAMTELGVPTITFDWDVTHGWRTSMSRGTEESATLGYTKESRLASYADTSSAGTTRASYEYDASGQRTRSIVATASGSAVTTVATDFEYEGLNLLSLSATRTAASVVGTYAIAYLYGEDNRPYAGVYTEGATIIPFVVITSDRGDVLALLDRDGEAFARYSYDAWGNPNSTTASGTASVSAARAADIMTRQPLRYAGYVWDGESRTYYCSARNYDPATGQFLSKDPAKADGEESAYQYCGGDPVGTVDPSGMLAVGAFKTVYTLSYAYWAHWSPERILLSQMLPELIAAELEPLPYMTPWLAKKIGGKLASQAQTQLSSILKANLKEMNRNYHVWVFARIYFKQARYAARYYCSGSITLVPKTPSLYSRATRRWNRYLLTNPFQEAT